MLDCIFIYIYSGQTFHSVLPFLHIKLDVMNLKSLSDCWLVYFLLTTVAHNRRCMDKSPWWETK